MTQRGYHRLHFSELYLSSHNQFNVCNTIHMVQKKEILVNDDSLWSDLQSSFSDYYPYLKIEIIQHRHRPHRNNTSSPITWLTPIIANEACIIDINENKTVTDVLNDFKNMLGLVIQISRKSGNVWNIISITCEWTLKRQNAAGEFICAQLPISISI